MHLTSLPTHSCWLKRAEKRTARHACVLDNESYPTVRLLCGHATLYIRLKRLGATVWATIGLHSRRVGVAGSQGPWTSISWTKPWRGTLASSSSMAVDFGKVAPCFTAWRSCFVESVPLRGGLACSQPSEVVCFLQLSTPRCSKRGQCALGFFSDPCWCRPQNMQVDCSSAGL